MLLSSSVEKSLRFSPASLASLYKGQNIRYQSAKFKTCGNSSQDSQDTSSNNKQNVSNVLFTIFLFVFSFQLVRLLYLDCQ